MDKPNQIKNLEKEALMQEQKDAVPEKQENIAEKPEISSTEMEAIKEELRREIELMDQDPALKKESEDKARKIGSFAADKILEHLLEIAQQRGLIFALSTAKKMNDPYVLDTFHDLLAKEGYYKKFVK